MLSPATTNDTAAGGPGGPPTRRSLFTRYAAIFLSVVCLAVVTSGALDIWFSYREQKELLVRIQREQAEAAAAKISQFITEIENQMGWATLLPWNASTFGEWRFDAFRLLHQAPALMEISQLDASGFEQFRISRYARDVIGSHMDYSNKPAFYEAEKNKVYYGPIYFVNGSEPYMTIALAGSRKDYGVIVGQVNLKFIWDIVSQIKAGKHGQAYLVDGKSRLIAHPDISLVLRNIDMSRLPQVRAVEQAKGEPTANRSFTAVNLQGKRVLSAYARIVPLNWFVFVDAPLDEAFAPLYSSITRSAIVMLGALGLALFASLLLTRSMVVPIRALRDGAVRIGGGDLSHRISIETNDELEALGNQFNAMATRLEESHATLERKVEERTHQLEMANLAKSRFIAVASHDLRQPLHALGLFVGQLRGRIQAKERSLILSRIDLALAAMNELFNALLDISKLDAGAMSPSFTSFSVAQLLKYIEMTFAEVAKEKGLSLRIVPCDVWIRSDFILLERIMFNLVSNAVRYTALGKVVIGCRRKGSHLTIEVWDSGPGIAVDHRQNIFSEFYRIARSENDRRGGLGLGLAIVDRLCRLLNHPIRLISAEGKGSCFAVSVPIATKRERTEEHLPIRNRIDISRGKSIVVVDDDPLVLEGMSGLFKSWGCEVVTASNKEAVLAALSEQRIAPDLIISDYHLPRGMTGIEVIEAVRGALRAPIPAFLISGDTDQSSLRDAESKGFHLLHKPVEPMALRAMCNMAFRGGKVTTTAI